MPDFLQAVDTDGGKAEPSPVTLVSGGAEVGTAGNPFKMGATGRSFTDQSITSLSSGQAAGTSTILAANANRTSLKIVPPADCYLAVATGKTTGIPLYGGVENTFEGNGCPTNTLYIVGLTASAAVLILEA